MLFNTLGAKVLRTIGALSQEDQAPNASDLAVLFEAANDMLDAWNAKNIVAYAMDRNLYPVVSNLGGPTNPYTVGSGGDIDQTRPVDIPRAGLVVGTSDPAYEIPLYRLGWDEWVSRQIKALSSNLCTEYYYNPDYQNTGVDYGLGQLFLLPIPNGGTTPLYLALYSTKPLPSFADQATTEYYFPPGYAEALRYQIAKRALAEFAVPDDIVSRVEKMAAETFGIIQKPNVRVPHLRTDFGAQGQGGLYDWRTGTNVRRVGG